MIHPIQFTLEDFEDCLGSREVLSFKLENLKGAELVDSLLLLRFMKQEQLQTILKEKQDITFHWLDKDPTPAEFRNIAEVYRVLLEVVEPTVMNIYIQLGEELDDSMLQVDIPNFRFNYIYIADCNYRMLQTGSNLSVLSLSLMEFRPLLVFRRLILDCSYCGGTDIHFASIFMNKQPCHHVQYRIKREIENSSFILEFSLTQRVIQSAVAKLSSASAADLDSAEGVTTDIPDLFGDGTVDLRLTGHKVEAGLYIVIAIQQTDTTLLKVSELGFPNPDVRLIRDLARRRTGLTLVTGEMRSGKNTTIFAMLNEIVHEPIRIMEYSNPVENRMPFPQVNYKGDLGVLKSLLRMAKKEDIDIAVINEVPNADIAFAVRDLVNSAIGVITTTHVNRVWHLPNKLWEFFGNDYKSIISQLNVCINQKMFRRWYGTPMTMIELDPSESARHQFAYDWGVRHHAIPEKISDVKYKLQPLTEILIFTDEIKIKLLNFDEMWRAEMLLRDTITEQKGTIETKLARYIDAGICPLSEMWKIF